MFEGTLYFDVTSGVIDGIVIQDERTDGHVVCNLINELDDFRRDEVRVTIEKEPITPEEWRPCCFTEFRNQWCFMCPWCEECHKATERRPGQPDGPIDLERRERE